MATDSTDPEIDLIWHESLVFGGLERAYLKETNLRNVEKSGAYRNKFEAIARECQLSEGINSATYGGGRNETRMTITR